MPVGDILFKRIEACSRDELENIGKILGVKEYNHIPENDLVISISKSLRYNASHSIGHLFRSDPHGLEYKEILRDVAKKMSTWSSYWNTKFREKTDLELEEMIWEYYNITVSEQFSKLTDEEKAELEKKLRKSLKTKGYSEAAITSIIASIVGGGTAAVVAPAVAYSIAAASTTGLAAVWASVFGVSVSGSLLATTAASVSAIAAAPFLLYWAGTPAMRKVIPAVLLLITYYKIRNLEIPEDTPHANVVTDSKEFVIENPISRGDHIFVSRLMGSYSHHGIYGGDDKVIHFDGEPTRMSGASIRLGSLEYFANGGKVKKVTYPSELCFSNHDVYNRAVHRLEHTGYTINNKKYHLFSNNCEHFSSWARTGIGTSLQVDSFMNSIFTGSATYGLRVAQVVLTGARLSTLASPLGIATLIVPTVIQYFLSTPDHTSYPSLITIIEEQKLKIVLLELLLSQSEVDLAEVSLLLSELQHLDKVSCRQYVTTKLLDTTGIIRSALLTKMGSHAEQYNVFEDIRTYLVKNLENMESILSQVKAILFEESQSTSLIDLLIDYAKLLDERRLLFEDPIQAYLHFKFKI